MSYTEAELVRTMFANRMQQIPERYRLARLKNLQPVESIVRFGATLDKQKGALTLMKSNPLGNYALFGAPGTGKTTLLAALYAEATKQFAKQYGTNTSESTVWWVNMPQWMAEINAFMYNKGPRPNVTTQLIKATRDNGKTPRLFIDEFDKVSGSEHSGQQVGLLMDAIYGTGKDGGQLCIASNMTFDELSATFGVHTGRRIEEMCELLEY